MWHFLKLFVRGFLRILRLQVYSLTYESSKLLSFLCICVVLGFCPALGEGEGHVFMNAILCPFYSLNDMICNLSDWF